MDNTGSYITLARLLNALVRRSLAEGSHITLSNKSGNNFNFSPENPTPVIGDWIVQADRVQQISGVGDSLITLLDGTDIFEGMVRLIKTEFSDTDLTDAIAEGMDFIDTYTGQWFNKREFAPFTFEGNNSDLILLRVPIIEIEKLMVNDCPDPLSATHFKAFTSRRLPDDRRNPRIKLDNVLFGGLFLCGKFSRIIGSFGFLEPDGSTPKEIKTATERLAISKLKADRSGIPDDLSRGPIKREKTDIHEIEYHKPAEAYINKNIPVITGDPIVDRALATYRAAPMFGGSFSDAFAPRLSSGRW